MAEKQYEITKAAIDPVIFTIHATKLKILLHRREKEPFRATKELPGGLLAPNETAEEALKRKLKELIGLDNIFFKQFYTFTEPMRDPRFRVVSIGFISLINQEKVKDMLEWQEFESLGKLAFDHNKIAQKARQYLKENTDPTIIRNFMPETFPLNKLQAVYELIEEKKYDNRNFRKRMTSSGVVEETEILEENVSHRPARMFRFSK